jgi:hypothetical protein
VTFPQTPLSTKVEAYIDGAWVNLTTKVYGAQVIRIDRGRSTEGTQVDRSTCKLTINNRDGAYSPRNPLGAYYGKIGRNTPLRVGINHGLTRLLVDGTDVVTAPDTAGLSITGDIDIRVDLSLKSWTSYTDLVSKWTGSGNQRSYAFAVDTGGILALYWSADGTTFLTAAATAVVPAPLYGRKAVRVTLDVNNGAGGKTARFYYSDTISGTWTQLGDAVTTGTTTSIFNSTAIARVGANVNIYDRIGRGEIYAVKILDGIAGTERGNPDFTVQTDGASSFADAAGNTWTVPAGVELTNYRARFCGEIPAWPQVWDVTGRDVRASIDAAGILRRLNQGASPLKSTLFRALTSSSAPLVAYWPMEDGENSRSAASATGGSALQIIGSPDMATYGGFEASAPLPLMRSARFSGTVPAYTSTGTIQLRFLINIPAAGSVNGASLMRLTNAGSAYQWDVIYGTGGTLKLQARSTLGVLLMDSGSFAFGVDGDELRMSIELDQNGANIDWQLSTLNVGDSTGLFINGTLNSETIGRAVTAVFGYALDDVAIGHLSIEKQITDMFDLAAELDAYTGERAGTRIERLCEEEAITFYALGDLTDTPAMGPQSQSTLLSLLREAAETDLGILYEPRELTGLAYRPRATLYNQDVALSLSYPGHQLVGLVPVDDDQAVTNDVTVSRVRGSSARTTLEVGALSVQSPPDGVGRYDTGVTINPETDAVLADHSGWRLHLGTVDEARYPTVELNLANASFSSTLRTQVMELDLGDNLAVADPPSWLPPEDIRQMLQGSSETLSNFQHDTTFNCSPASPWNAAGVYDETGSRYSSDGSTLAEDLTTTETAVDVATPSGPLWTTSGGELPLDIRVGGEVMTVTAISGASSPQTFTVTRSVNGVVKTHATGAVVELDRGVRYVI